MEYKFIEKTEYHKNKKDYLKLIDEMFYEDYNKLANVNEIEKHLDFIFSNEYTNNAFLCLLMDNEKIISMVNFFEYNNMLNEWCLFAVFTKQNYRSQGYAKKILEKSILHLKNYKCSKLISGIEKDNIASIKLHEEIGFEYSNCNWNELADGFPENHLGFTYKFK